MLVDNLPGVNKRGGNHPLTELKKEYEFGLCLELVIIAYANKQQTK